MDKNVAIATILTAYLLESSDDETAKQPKKTCRKVWTKDWVARREQEGFYEN